MTGSGPGPGAQEGEGRGRDSAAHRDVGLAVQGLAGAAVPGRSPPGPLARALRGAVRRGGGQQRVYRLPEATTFDHWAARTPADFVIAVKASRYLTHVKRLADPAEPVARLMERAAILGPKLGPVLVQVPETLHADPVLLDEVPSAFGSGVKVAFEPRDRSWETDRVRSVLEGHGAALCLPTGRGSPRRTGAPRAGATSASTRGRPAPHPATGGPPWRPGPSGWRPCGTRPTRSSPSSTTTGAGAPRYARRFALAAAGLGSVRPVSRAPARPPVAGDR